MSKLDAQPYSHPVQEQRQIEYLTKMSRLRAELVELDPEDLALTETRVQLQKEIAELQRKQQRS